MHFVSWFRKWWGGSIRHRLLVSNIIVVVFFLVLIGYLSFSIGRTGVQNEVNQRNNQLAMLIAQDLKDHFDNIWGNMRLFTYQLKTSTNMLSLQARAMLEFRRISPLTYRALYLFDSEGHLLIHLADPLEDLLAVQDATEIINRPPILLTDDILVTYKAARNGNMFLSPTYIIGPDQVPIVYVGIPITAKDRRSSQIVVAEIDLRSIWRKVDKIRIGQTGRVFVVSQEGTTIAHPDRAYIGQQLAPELKPVLSGYEGRTAYTDPISGARLLASYSPLGGQSGWGVVVEQEQTEVLAPVNRIASITLGVLVLAISMATIATILIERSITLPLQHLAEASRRIARTGDLSQQVRVEGHGEVSQLATMFNQMTTSLQRAEKNLRKYSGHLEELVKKRTSELEGKTGELEQANIRLQELDRLKSMFIASMSHELRTPLNSIIGFTGIILQGISGEITEDQRKELTMVTNSANHLLALINDVIDVSKIETGKVELFIEEFNLADLMQEVKESFKVAADEKNLKLSLEMPERLIIKGDKRRIKQVIMNLVSNAVKFTDRGEIEIKVKKKDEEVKVSVTDTGIGIKKENMEKLFTQFSRIYTKGKPITEGTGLGLYLSKKIVELLGGQIKAESEFGKGSKFTFTFPLEYREVKV